MQLWVHVHTPAAYARAYGLLQNVSLRVFFVLSYFSYGPGVDVLCPTTLWGTGRSFGDSEIIFYGHNVFHSNVRSEYWIQCPSIKSKETITIIPDKTGWKRTKTVYETSSYGIRTNVTCLVIAPEVPEKRNHANVLGEIPFGRPLRRRTACVRMINFRRVRGVCVLHGRFRFENRRNVTSS